MHTPPPPPVCSHNTHSTIGKHLCIHNPHRQLKRFIPTSQGYLTMLTQLEISTHPKRKETPQSHIMSHSYIQQLSCNPFLSAPRSDTSGEYTCIYPDVEYTTRKPPSQLVSEAFLEWHKSPIERGRSILAKLSRRGRKC